MKDLQINLDWEHEFRKDAVYLLEAKILMEQEVERLPAEIIVVDKYNILKKEYEYKGDSLPF